MFIILRTSRERIFLMRLVYWPRHKKPSRIERKFADVGHCSVNRVRGVRNMATQFSATITRKPCADDAQSLPGNQAQRKDYRETVQ